MSKLKFVRNLSENLRGGNEIYLFCIFRRMVTCAQDFFLAVYCRYCIDFRWSAMSKTLNLHK